MGEARPRFGSQRSADVKLFLTDQDENISEKNPVHLHSQIVKRLKGFEGKLSNNRWPYKSIDIRVATSHSFDHYLKCIKIMYDEHVDFPNIIDECLAILSVAAEMSAEECINKCMDYLEAVRWSAEESSQIRKVLSSDGLKLKISPDLDARLHQEEEDEDRTDFVEKFIREMVSVIKEGSSSRNFETVDKDLRGILNGNASKDFVDACGRVLLQEFKASIVSHGFSTVERIFERIQLCDGGVLEAAFKAFCEDAKFMEYVKTTYVSEYGPQRPVFEIIMWLMNAIGEGKIIISRTSRVSFLTAWLPIMGTVKWPRYSSIQHSTELDRRLKELDEAVVKVVGTLPRVDQKSVCLVWAEVYRKNEIDITMPITLSKSL